MIWGAMIPSLGYPTGIPSLIVLKPLTCTESIHHLQSDIDSVSACYQDLRLRLNASKTKALLISAAPTDQQLDLHLDDVPICQVSCFRYLGITIDHEFSFAIHSQEVAARVKREIGVLFRLFGGRPAAKQFWNVYQKKILPVLLYALHVAVPRFQKDWALLEKKN